MYCEKCGTEIKKEATFCTNCGNAIKQVNNNAENKESGVKDITKIKKTAKKIIITVLVLVIVVTSGYKGVDFFLKQNGKATYKCTNDDIERAAEEICKNLKGGKAEVDEIKSFSDGDFSVYFNVSLSGKQKETIRVNFDNYKDSDKIGTISIDMSRDAYGFHGENTYNSCIAIASAIEKTFLGWRYVDEYSDYSNDLAEMKSVSSAIGTDDVVLHNYTINDGPAVTILVDNSKWMYRLKLSSNQTGQTIVIDGRTFDLS